MEFETEDFLKICMSHRERHGRKATARLLTVLGNKRPMYEAITDEKSQLLLKKIFNEMDDLLDKIVAGKDSEKERIKYNIMVELTNEWAEVLASYKKHINMLKGD